MVKPTKTPKGQPTRKHKKRRLSHKDHFVRLMKEVVLVEVAPEEDASYLKFQDALDTRTAVCRRLEILVRSSTLYTPSAQARLIKCLRDDYVRGDRTRKVIDNLRHSDFISAGSMANQDSEFITKEVTESTRLFFEGSKELQEIGDQIAAQFS
ncbi:hypothetical protein EDB19DRAFT_1655995 [Suillus lakei]|nr:hypothetical protein EDB19DRAFT_1655995 [Suillus lakei]